MIFFFPFFSFCNKYYKYPEGSSSWYSLYNACSSWCNAILVVGKKVLWIFGKNASGNFLTGFINSFINMLIHKICYLFIMENSGLLQYPSFDKAIRLKVYGDDNVHTFHKSISEHWNMKTFSISLKYLFNMDFTAADKSSVFPEFYESPSDVEFLCRRWIRTREGYHCPLSKDSLIGMLFYTRKPAPGFSQRDQLNINVENALREIYHHGRDAYMSFRSELEYYCQFGYFDLPVTSYDDIHSDWISQYRNN